MLLKAGGWAKGRNLPSNVICAEYLPFSHLLPKSAAIVHHGGIGTTSQSLRHAVPQLVLPMAFDQFDNGSRVMSLGCGESIPLRFAKDKEVVDAIRRIMCGDKINESLRRVQGLFGSQVRDQSCADQVADWVIKDVASRTCTS